MYMPAHLRATTDMTLFYEKPPAEMSRYELQQLEEVLIESELQDQDEIAYDGNTDDEEDSVKPVDPYEGMSEEERQRQILEMRQSDEFKGIQEEIKKLQPHRIGCFKRYWNKFKYNRTRREDLIEMFNESDKQTEYYLDKDFIPW